MKNILFCICVVIIAGCQFGIKTDVQSLEKKTLDSLSAEVTRIYYPTTFTDHQDTLFVEMEWPDFAVIDRNYCDVLKNLILCKILDTLNAHRYGYGQYYFKLSLESDSTITEEKLITDSMANLAVKELKQDTLWYRFSSYIGKNMRNGEVLVFNDLIKNAYDNLKLKPPKLDFVTLVYLYSRQCAGKIGTEHFLPDNNYIGMLRYIDAIANAMEQDGADIWKGHGYNKRHISYFTDCKCVVDIH